MKKITLFAIALLASVVSFAALNPFAYGLSSQLSADETKLTVNYSLNADATYVNIVVLNGETVVKHFSSDNITKGSHTVELSTAELSNAHTPKGTTLTWKIEVGGSSVKTPTLQDGLTLKYSLPRGIGVDRSPESPYFGRIYTTDATGGSGYHASEGKGLYVFDAALNPITNSTGGKRFTGGIEYGDDDISRVVVADDGRVFLSRFSPTTVSPVVEVNPANLNANFKDVFTSITGNTIGIDVKGAGKNLKLVMLATANRTITEYDLGTATQWTSSSPSRTYTKTDKTTGKSLSLVTDNAYISYDLTDGVWITQHRATATTTEPTIAHVIPSGMDYNNFNAGLSHNGTSNGGIAISPNGKQLAVVGAGTCTLTIYNISKTDGQISLTKAHTISTAGKNHTALEWDYAGNLYVANRSAETVTFYAMPYSGMVATPAPSKYAFQLQEEVQGTFYTLAVNVDETKGTVTGNDGQYEEGATATLTATAKRGYKFANWTAGETTYTENPLTLTVNSDLTVTANFEALPAYTITATVNNETMGSVTGADTYYKGETVTLKATANTGHAFVDWSNGATEPTLTFTATKDSTVQANFKVLSYTVALATNDEAKGSVAGAGTYDYGTEVELTATPAEGYELLYWSDRSTDNPRTITVDGNEALSAYFVKEYEKEPTFTIEKVWENTNVPAATGDGYQAVGWDGKIYMQNKTVGKIQVFSNGTDAAVDYATSGTGQQIAIDEAGNLIVFNAYFASSTPSAILIYAKGSTEGKSITFTLPNPGQCHFFTASGDIYSAEGGYVYFYCQNTTVVNRVKIANGAATAEDVTVDVVGNNITAGNTQNHVMVDIFGNLVAHSRSNAASWINVHTNESSKTFAATLAGIKLSTLGGCTFELGGKELWAYNVGTTNYNSEWNIYNMTDDTFLSDTVFYAIDKVATTNYACNWLNVQKVDEQTAYIYQFCPKKGVAAWKVTCDTGEEPENPTVLDNTVVAPQVEKVVRNGQVLIIRDGKTFNMMGQEVR